MTGLAIAVAFLLVLWLSLLYLPFRWRPVGQFLIVQKTLAVAYLPIMFAVAAALMVVGAVLGSWWIAVPAGIATLEALTVIVRIGSVRTDLSGALGVGWTGRISAERQAAMTSRRWTGRLRRSPEPRLRRDVSFASVPGTDRALRCDVWQPPIGVPSSGVAVVYLHGSAYYFLDKDAGTRPLFRYLAAQGHVIVDVAYRLFPETDVLGMVADAKRAIAWVRGHAADLGIDPALVVLGGGSAGGHLSLLAAYGHDASVLTPPELAGADLRVAGVVSLYGQVDLEAMYWHTRQQVLHAEDPQPDWGAPPSRALKRLFGEHATRLRLQFLPHCRCDWLMGGTPREAPDRYARVSVLNYIRSDCPPTLLLHGTHDEMAPVSAVRQLQRRLDEAGAPVTAVYLPHTDHGFDLIGTRWSPAARIAVHVLERFLAVIGSLKATEGVKVVDASSPPSSRHAA